MKYLKEKKRIYFIAIGGIGMSAIAFILLKMGYKISGSDLKPNSMTNILRSEGANIYLEHKGSNIVSDVDLVVYSSCIRADNPEMLEAQKRGIMTMRRGKVLAELVADKKGITVCGSHGKTTTSSMIATILTDAGLDPTALIGGEVNFFGSNARLGNGQYLVAEADESDGSFLDLEPLISVITNIDEDHMDYFKDTDCLVSSFRKYVSNIKKGGCLVYCADDPRALLIEKDSKVDTVSYGLKAPADLTARNIKSENGHLSFDCFKDKIKIGNFKTNVPGIHNVSNALAAVCVGLRIGLTYEEIKSGLAKFTGTKRRFQLKGCFKGVTIVEDYAHHPAEIMATLSAAESYRPKRLIGVFQPHRFTRTLHLADRFGTCFEKSNYLILTDIYSASEKAINGINGRLLYDKVVASGHKNVFYIEKNRIAEHICNIKKPGDMVIVLGAGDINSVADELVEKLG